MIFRWMFEFLNFCFVFSLGVVTLWLCFQSLTFDKVRRSSPKQRAELLLEVYRDGAPYLRIPLNKSHYLIGRGPECDIPLRGLGIPLQIGEIYGKEKGYFLKNFQENYTKMNDETLGKELRKISTNDKIEFSNYLLRVK